MNPNPGAPPPGGPGGPQTPQQKSSTGKIVLIILGVLGGLALLCCIGFMIAGKEAMKDPNFKKGINALGKGMKMAEKGMTAPGTDQLRKAGCTQAMALDLSDAMEIVEMFADAGDKGPPDDMGIMVICQGNMFDKLPTDCGELAKIYVDAAHPAKGFALMVQKQGEQKPICQNSYEADGTLKSEGFGKKH